MRVLEDSAANGWCRQRAHGRDQPIRRMVTAGSKGSYISVPDLCALGQQSLEGGPSSPRDAHLDGFAHNDLSLAMVVWCKTPSPMG